VASESGKVRMGWSFLNPPVKPYVLQKGNLEEWGDRSWFNCSHARHFVTLV